MGRGAATAWFATAGMLAGGIAGLIARSGHVTGRAWALRVIALIDVLVAGRPSRSAGGARRAAVTLRR